MRKLTVSRGALLCFLVSLLFAVSFCGGVNGNKVVEVVGTGECADCAQSNFKTSQAFSGLRVTIDCKPENGEFKTRGIGELDEEGKFKVSLPEEIVEDEKLKEECYAQLHSASATPCPAHGGLESSKIFFKTKNEDKHTFGLPGKLKFSTVTCASAFFWPYFKHPPLSKFPHPKFKLPPSKSFGHPIPFPPKVLPPKYKKPYPPLQPKPLPPKPPVLPKPLPPKPPVLPKPLPPKPPVLPKPLPPKPPVLPKPLPPKPPVLPKPLPPKPPVLPKPLPPKPPVLPKPLPPKPPVLPKPLPPKPPVLPKPLPPKPPVHIHKPKPPVPKVLPHPIPKVLPPPAPTYKPKPPIFIKPLPPLPKIPPFHKKPCPPLPKLPPIPKIPPKNFHHPKFGKWPPHPPFASHP